MRGIDVSSYQGTIDWAKAKSDGVDFAIIKIIRKDGLADKQFENNWNGCVSAGVTIQGVYNYTYATTVAKAVSDAKRVVEVLGTSRHPFVWLDYEDATLPKDSLACDIINAYGDVITAHGCDFGVYFGMSYYNSYIKKSVQRIKAEYRKFWIARYPSNNSVKINDAVNESKRPTCDGTLLGWQYSSKGKVAGISGNVDINEWYVDIEASAKPIVAGYGIAQFMQDARSALGLPITATAKEMFERSIKVSTTTNKNHAVVTPLERYFKSLGLYDGDIEADKGKKPSFGNGMKKATMLYQQKYVGSTGKNIDGIISARGYTWKKLLGI